MSMRKNLDSLKSRYEIKDFADVSGPEFSRLQKAIADGDIGTNELKILTDAIPNFVQLQISYIESLKEVVGAAKETQKQALTGISGSLDALNRSFEVLLKADHSEVVTLKIIDATIELAKINVELAKVIQQTNNDNNSLWKYMSGAAAAVVFVVGGLLVSRKK